MCWSHTKSTQINLLNSHGQGIAQRMVIDAYNENEEQITRPVGIELAVLLADEIMDFPRQHSDMNFPRLSISSL